jgi:hypothetical protein
MKRRLLAAVLLPVLLDPLALFGLLRRPAHECSDHICACGSHCPLRGVLPCHESGASERGVSALCNHDQLPTLTAGVPAVLPAALTVAVPPGTPAAEDELPLALLWGSSPPDPPPPKAA